ncbi:hypothetical protein EDB86DRAFT_2793777 [Lactarius hatsudake]|nr:hypothetical protein EDB86DRAFT_2793777 [Lactarius hatsudake]
MNSQILQIGILYPWYHHGRRNATFYHVTVPITAELVRCVQARRYPVETTRMRRCVQPVSNQDSYTEEGLVLLPNRRRTLQPGLEPDVISLRPARHLGRSG